MFNLNDPIPALRQALQFSPDNLPLRQHLAETLLNRGEAAEAEQEFLRAIALSPNSLELKLGLARAFYQQSKTSQALVIVEDLLSQGESSSLLLTLHARLLLQAGQVEQAVQQFRLALSQDPTLQESDLVEWLGLDADEIDEVQEGRWRLGGSELLGGRDSSLQRPTLTFEEVGGMEALKEEIRLKIIYPLTHAEMYRAYGQSIGGGILMYGPPGCGKTHLARATAGEIRANFIAVGIDDVLDLWLGNGEKNLHDVFDQARRSQPCVLFFDEVDALAASRTDLRQSAARQTINQFLAELDGVQYSNEGVLILAATNAPWHLDAAFRRPGRFDRILFVPPPDAIARQQILALLCRSKPVLEIDYPLLSKKTEGFSGADLKAVVDRAVERKLKEAVRTGIPKPLTTRDLAIAIEATRPSTREWFSTARNYVIHANQDGVYDDVRKYLKL